MKDFRNPLASYPSTTITLLWSRDHGSGFLTRLSLTLYNPLPQYTHPTLKANETFEQHTSVCAP